MSENIDHFNRVVLVVFDRLYAQFPVAVNLLVDKIAEEATPGILPTQFGYQELESTFESIKFLSDEGFLTYSTHLLDGSMFANVKLTLKGLTILGQIPDSLEQKKTLIARIRSALADASKDAGKEVVQQLVVKTLSWGTAAAPAAIAALTNL